MALIGDGTNAWRAGRPRRAAGARATAAEGWLVAQVRTMTVADVLDAVESGTLTVWDAVEAERAGKGRATLLRQLGGRL